MISIKKTHTCAKLERLRWYWEMPLLLSKRDFCWWRNTWWCHQLKTKNKKKS